MSKENALPQYAPANSLRSLVSVQMSVLNGIMHLADAVECILNQSFIDFEFIMLNDGSTDGSLSLLQKMLREIHWFDFIPEKTVDLHLPKMS